MRLADLLGRPRPSHLQAQLVGGGTGPANPPSYVGVGTAAGSFAAPGTTTLAPTVPSVAVGDLLVATVCIRSLSDTLATPDGWTLIIGPSDSHAALPVRTYVFKRLATGSDAVTFTKTGTGGAWRGIILGATGAGSTNVANAGSSGTSEPVLPTITPAADQSLVLGIACHQVTSATMATPPTGHTKRVDSASVNIPNIIITTRVVESAAASGTIAFDINGSGGGWTAHQVAIAPK